MTNFTEQFNGMIKTNLSFYEKYWNEALKTNRENTEDQLNLYFEQLRNNVDYLRNIWESGIKNNKEVAENYCRQMTTLQNKFQTIYQEAVTTNTEAKTPQQQG